MIDYETYVRIRNFFIRDGLTYSQISDEQSKATENATLFKTGICTW